VSFEVSKLTDIRDIFERTLHNRFEVLQQFFEEKELPVDDRRR